MFHKKTKQIDVRLYFIRDVIARGKIIVNKNYTKDNLADMITKPVTIIKFEKCLDLMGS